MANEIPPDTRAPGQSGHITDHNDIADALTVLQDTLNGILTGGLTTTGSVDITQPGQGLRVAEGAGAKQGAVTLAGGTATVTTASVTASSRIQLTSQQDGGTPGWLRVTARVPGTSFTITSSSASDTSTVAYFITEPG